MLHVPLSFALSCLGKPTDLTRIGGSLSPLRITDQNGLGICHIEQLHKMLKARLPGHPDLSRVQLAIMEKKIRDRRRLNKKAVRWGLAPDIGGTYIDAGLSCSAFNLIKGQKICPASGDQFEQLTKMKPGNQERIIETLSAYFDSRANQMFSVSFGGTNFFDSALDEALKTCAPEPSELQSLLRSFEKYLEMNKILFGFIEFTPNKGSKILSSSDFAMDRATYLAGITYEEHLRRVLTNNPRFIFSGLGGEDVNKELLLLAQKMKLKESCIAEEAKKDLGPLCPTYVGPARKNLLNLVDLGFSLHQVMRLYNGSFDRDTFFSEAFNCSTPKVSIPKTLNCTDNELLDEAKAAKNQIEHQRYVAKKVDAFLERGTPVGISICTRFFKDPTAVTVRAGSADFKCGDEKDPGFRKNEGSHAVTIVGSRCRNGVQEYLVQNSWGSGCFYSSHYECTKRGGFWAPGSIIFSNTRRLSTLE